jgi:hypothetical protein
MPSTILFPLLASPLCLVVCNLHLKVGCYRKNCNLLLQQFPIFFYRLLLFRHHILDVVGGVFLGLIEGLVMAVIWIGPETATYLVKWISDDRISGNDAELI